MSSGLVPRKNSHLETALTITWPANGVNGDSISDEDDARGLRAKAALHGADRAARWRRRFLILWLYFALGLASYSLASSARRNFKFATTVETLNLNTLSESTRVLFSRTKPSLISVEGSAVADDRSVSVSTDHKAENSKAQSAGCKLEDVHWQVSDDGTLFVLDQWVLDTAQRVAFMVPAPNIAAASGHADAARQSPLREAASPGRKGGIALRCAFDDTSKG